MCSARAFTGLINFVGYYEATFVFFVETVASEGGFKARCYCHLVWVS